MSGYYTRKHKLHQRANAILINRAFYTIIGGVFFAGNEHSTYKKHYISKWPDHIESIPTIIPYQLNKVPFRPKTPAGVSAKGSDKLTILSAY